MRILVLIGFSIMLAACAPAAPPATPGAPATLPAAPNVPPEAFPTKPGQPVVPTATFPSVRPTSTSTAQAKATEPVIRYSEGSTQKVCQLTGQTDREFNLPTVNQTETRFGLIGNDLGYSFEHDGKLFFLFSDSKPTTTFNRKPNLGKDPPGLADDNDAIAFTSDTSVDQCLKLDFIHYPNGAYKNPVVLNAQGQPAIALRIDEVPTAGISDGGKMYVIFATDNYVYPSPGPSKEQGGFGTRTVVGESDDNANTFHWQYGQHEWDRVPARHQA